ncbi:MAG: pyruvate kinase [Armatimonadota bacterium]|nr:pyruvate kinase [Armatimonadota bacterium]
MFRKTKIVCTLGPGVDSEAQIRALIDAGMNVARINCSHGDPETREKWVGWVRAIAAERGVFVAVLFDLQGPKFRLGKVVGETMEVAQRSRIKIGAARGQLPVQRKEILSVLTPGRRILIGDGDVSFRVATVDEDGIGVVCLTGGEIRSRQGITVAGVAFDSRPLLPKDIEDLQAGAKLGIDYVAVSYVRRASDVEEAVRRARTLDPSLKVIAKIEMREAVQDIERIISAADGIMVARGDMGLQMAIEDVPLVQKRIIGLCRSAGKPVITATQMMESMVENPRPTRAEATDIANAIFDGTDAIMLSGETAYGKYPITAVQYMDRISQKTERSSAFLQSIMDPKGGRASDATEAVAHAAVEIAATMKVKAIVCFSSSGFSARMVAKYKPRSPIICATPIVKTARQAALFWGVKPLLTPPFGATEEMIDRGFGAAVDKGDLRVGDTVVVTAGLPVGRTGTTNFVTLLTVD